MVPDGASRTHRLIRVRHLQIPKSRAGNIIRMARAIGARARSSRCTVYTKSCSESWKTLSRRRARQWAEPLPPACLHVCKSACPTSVQYSTVVLLSYEVLYRVCFSPSGQVACTECTAEDDVQCWPSLALSRWPATRGAQSIRRANPHLHDFVAARAPGLEPNSFVRRTIVTCHHDLCAAIAPRFSPIAMLV